MTVIDKLMLASGHWNAILYAGATLFVVGLTVGVVVALVLTSVVREHGYFYIMLEREAAQARENLEQWQEQCKATTEFQEERAISEAMIKIWDDNYYAGFAADDEDEPEDDPFLSVIDTVNPNETRFTPNPTENGCLAVKQDRELFINVHIPFAPAEAATA